jgi:hypothetical protein
MSIWSKYKRKPVLENRRERQFQTGLDIWLEKKDNSIIQIARMVRCFCEMSGREIDFDESISIAKRLSRGRHQ